MNNARFDENYNPSILGVSSVNYEDPVTIAVNPLTHAVLIDGDSLYPQLDARYVNHGADGEGTEDLNYFALDTTYTPTGNEPIGNQWWSQDERTIQFAVEGGSIDVNKEIFDIYVDQAGNLAEGDVVSVVGISGNRQAVAKTNATSRTSATACIGMVTNVNSDNTVRVTKKGRVRKLNTNGMTEGLPVYANATGGYTQTVPTAPTYFIHVGIVEVAQTNNGIIDIDIRVSPVVKDISDVDGSDPDATGDLLTWNQTNSVWDRNTYNINDYLPVADFNDTPRFGFVVGYDGTQQTTISFDGTNTFTLAPTGTTWEYWRNGVKYTITGSKTVTLSATPPATKGLYYIYIDSTDGSLTASTTGWTLEDTKVPVASINWDNSLTPKYWISDERHSVLIDRRYHWEHHFSDGTEMITAPTVSGYTVAPASPTNTDNTFAISASVASDEDIKIVNSGIDDGGGISTNYTVFTRSAASTWSWVNSLVPYSYTGAGYINYDNAGTLTPGQNNRYYNSWLLVTNSSGQARYSFIVGQAEYTSLSLAQSKTFSELTKTGLNILEYVAIYQFTWYSNASYTTLGKVRLAAEPKPVSVSASGASTPVSLTHNSLSGLQGGTTGEYYHTTQSQNSEITLLESLKNTTITRDVNGYISEVEKTGGRTLIITRDENNYISEVTDSTYTWTMSRDGNNNLTGVTVT